MRYSEISSPVLYHSTDWGPEIIRDGAIKGSPIRLIGRATHGHEQEGQIGVCATRSMWFARAYASVIFALDLRKIKERYRIVLRAEGAYDPANDGDYRLEAEEFIICPQLEIDRYVTAIWLSDERADDPDYDVIREHPMFKGMYRAP